MTMPAWMDWFKKIMKIKSKFCVINYDDMKTNTLGSLRPVVKFLGYEMNKGVFFQRLRDLISPSSTKL